jgi:hypothetical protein
MFGDIGNNIDTMSVTINILEAASDREDFLRRINDDRSSAFAHKIEDFLRSYTDAREDVNKARAILGKKPFKFE